MSDGDEKENEPGCGPTCGYHGEERRRCSDGECQLARSNWAEKTLIPAVAERITKNEEHLWLKMRIQTAIMIAGTVIFCAAIFQYMSRNSIRDYDLVARDKYTTTLQHQSDMNRIESKIVSVETSVTSHLIDMREEIKSVLDRNLAAIQSRKGQ